MEGKMKAVTLLSGGMDSTTLLYQLLDMEFDVYSVGFYYGQKHFKELEYARRTCMRLRLPFQRIDIYQVNCLLSSALTTRGANIPHGHYEDDSMKVTVVPNRNMIMLSIAGGYAVSIGADILAYAAHAGDHTIYPDCRPEFVADFQKTLISGNYQAPKVFAPYINMSKKRIYEMGVMLKVPYEDTWSCYEGGQDPCGECGTCRERQFAMGTHDENGVALNE